MPSKTRKHGADISSTIYIPNVIIKSYIGLADFRKELDKALTLKNPVWIAKARFSRWQGWRSTTDEYIKFYKEVDNGFVIPRNYDTKSIRIILKDNRIKGVAAKFNSSIIFRDYQFKYLKSFPEIEKEDDKVLCVPCGAGKTVLGIHLSNLYGIATLILVPTHFLARQWQSRIEEFTNATYHVWKSTDKELPKGKHFYICSFDLFTVRNMPEWFKKSIGHVILDEAHRVGAATYIPILDELPAERRTALTATFRRSDGMHQILNYHFGNVYKMDYIPPRPKVYCVLTNEKVEKIIKRSGSSEWLPYFAKSNGVKLFETSTTIEGKWNGQNREHYLKQVEVYEKKAALNKKETAQLKSTVKKFWEQNHTLLDNHLTERTTRTLKCIRMIRECMDAGRTVLFLSKRKKMLKMLHKHFEEYNPMLIISKSTDKLTPAERKYMEKECRLFFGIFQLAKEGLDIDRLDTLALHLPLKDTEQPIGRINRLYDGKKDPLCLYLVDENETTKGLYRASQKYIRINAESKGNIKWHEVDKVL